MSLPEGLALSQSSLQDYVDCPRRFKLRYLDRQPWPAPQTANALEFERQILRGQAFHRVMRQAHSGIPPRLLERTVEGDPHLARWLSNYLASGPRGLPDELCEAEVALSAIVAGQRLHVRYDLLAGSAGGRWVIVDWKTGRRRSPGPWLRGRMQTKVYPWVLVEAGSSFNSNQAIDPGCVEMVYWFAEFPMQAEHVSYDAHTFSSDGAYLTALITDMKALSLDGYVKTENRRSCRVCGYRSLCWEDVRAGPWSEAGDVEGGWSALEDIDVESVTPIPF